MKRKLYEVCVGALCNLFILFVPKNSVQNSKHTLAGDFCNFLGLYKLAAKFYEKADIAEITTSETLKRFGDVLYKIKKYDAAVNTFRNLAIIENNQETTYKWAKTLEKQGKLYEALSKYKETICYDPSYVRAYMGMASIYEELERYDEALESYQTALTFCPNNSNIYVSLGILYDTTGQLDKAIGAFRNALLIDPCNTEAYFGWGIVLEQLNDYQGAIDRYRTALELDASYTDVKVRWAELYLKLGQQKEALDMFKQVIEADAEHPWALYGLACTYVSLGNISKAYKYIRKAMECDDGVLEELLSNASLLKVLDCKEFTKMQQEAA